MAKEVQRVKATKKGNTGLFIPEDLVNSFVVCEFNKSKAMLLNKNTGEVIIIPVELN